MCSNPVFLTDSIMACKNTTGLDFKYSKTRSAEMLPSFYCWKDIILSTKNQSLQEQQRTISESLSVSGRQEGHNSLPRSTGTVRRNVTNLLCITIVKSN